MRLINPDIDSPWPRLSEGVCGVPLERAMVRSFQPEDQAEVNRLYTEGLLMGWINPFESAEDLQDIERAYLRDRRNNFWIAKVDGRVVGMIAVGHDKPHVAQIRRLRVDRAWQDTCVPAMLIEAAIEHCKRHGFLKVIFNTHYPLDDATDLLERYGFEHARSKPNGDKQALEFYLNLYRRPESERDPNRTRLGA